MLSILLSNDFLQFVRGSYSRPLPLYLFVIPNTVTRYYLILTMPSSSLFLSVGTILSALSSTAVATQYSQSESFTGKNWLDAFKFETYDLNNGFVNYVTEGVAKSSKLYKVEGDDVMFGVDSTETLDYKKMPGRKSVRLEGKKNYNHGLFVLDVKAMPGVCGMWPAFWSLGQEPWPVKGEVRARWDKISRRHLANDTTD
jgi:hypothetical protein